MEELRVPTVPLAVVIRYFDERRLEGKVFLPSMAQTHAGPPRAEEWLNKGVQFFPFVPKGEPRAVILNKRYVVMLTIAAPKEQVEALQAGTERRIKIECGGLALEGSILIDMPTEHSRLFDWINRPEKFLTIRQGDEIHLVQKSRITMLAELMEEPRVD